MKFGGADIKESAYRYVTFNTGGGSEISTQKILRGQKAAAPDEKPAKKGYIFGGWSAFDFTAPVLENTEITAQWTVCDHSGSTAKPTCTDSAICSECGETAAAVGHQPKAGYMYDDDTHWRSAPYARTDWTKRRTVTIITITSAIPAKRRFQSTRAAQPPARIKQCAIYALRAMASLTETIIPSLSIFPPRRPPRRPRAISNTGTAAAAAGITAMLPQKGDHKGKHRNGEAAVHRR